MLLTRQVDYLLHEFKRQTNECNVAYNTTSQEFEETKGNTEIQHRHHTDVTQKLENIMENMDASKVRYEIL